MAEAKQVQEVMSNSFVQVNADKTIGEALMKLQDAQAQYGIVIGAQDNLLGLVTAEELRAGEANARVQTLIQNAPPVILEPNVTLNSAVRALAKDLVLKPQLSGIVVQTQGKVQGIVPRKTIVEHAARVVTRGTADRLEGSPIDVLFYECLIDHERKLVAYYDPAHPPTCSQGHKMNPVE